MTRAASVVRSRAMRVLRGINSQSIFGFIFWPEFAGAEGRLGTFRFHPEPGRAKHEIGILAHVGGPRAAPLQGKVACPRGSLAGNTVKFTERGLVLIEFWLEMKTGGRCTLPIRVSDNAVGIPEDRRRAIQCRTRWFTASGIAP